MISPQKTPSAEIAMPAAGVPGDARRLWTVEDLCRFLNVSKRWVHERTRRGEIPCYRLGTALRFDPKDIEGWVAKFHRPPAKE